MERRRRRTNRNKTITRKSRTQGRHGQYLSMRARRLQIYARRQIFQNHSLRPSPSLTSFLPNHFSGAERRTRASRGRATIITRVGRFPRKRQKDRESENKTDRARTSSGQSGVGNRNIFEFKSSIRNDGLRATYSSIRGRLREVDLKTRGG